ncbi:MAG TPA: protein-tyrosine phosphatase family protein [Allosphingosinicella sp.]|jgi:protein-tyrosine phosphatase
MRASIYWVDHPRGFRIGIMARPRAGEWLADEIAGWREEVQSVVSLLEAEEVSDLELADEEGLCRAAGIDFLSFPIPDRGVPASFGEARTLAEALCTRGAEGKAIAIHCRAGIGRSSIVAGAALILSGLSAPEAVAAIGKARGLNVPDTDEQLQWLHAFAEHVEAGRHEPAD